jgi:hypothetical protein
MGRRLSFLLAIALMGAAHGADDADPAPGPNLEGQAFQVHVQGQPNEGMLVFGHAQMAWLGTDSPEVIEEGDIQPGSAFGVMWMPYTTRELGGGKIGISSKAWGEFGGTIVGDVLMASWSSDGQIQMEVTGKRSERHFTIRPQSAHGKPLADARLLEGSGKRREAIEAYAKVIDADRFDLPLSAPALVALVRCCQALKDDQAVQGRWKELAKRYLDSPPPLDGTTQLALADAQEALLWKPWGAGDSLKLTVNQVDTHRTRREHTVTAGTTIQLAAQGDRHQKLRFERADPAAAPRIAAPPATAASAGGDGTPDAEAAKPVADDAPQEQAPGAVGIDGEGKEYAAKSVQAWGGAGSVSVSVEFDELPARLTSFTTVKLALVATQDQEWEFKAVDLKEGEAWETASATYRVTSVTGGDGQWTIGLIETRNQAGGAVTSMSTVGYGGDNGFTAEDERGISLPSTGMNSSGDGRKTTYQLRYASATKPVTLKQRIVTKTSTRTLHLSVDDIELP